MRIRESGEGGGRLSRAFFQCEAHIVARELIGSLLITTVGGERTAGIVVETEAYLAEGDEASHSFRGRTERNASMFRTGGHAYVYFIYGMHYCFNVVTGEAGRGEAVLIRAIEPVEGLETMRRRRMRNRDLANGPAKLAVALGIDRSHDGLNLVTSSTIWIEGGERASDSDIEVTPRVGITRSADLPLRWQLQTDTAHVRSTRSISGTR